MTSRTSASAPVPAAPSAEAPRFALAWAALAYALVTLTLAWPILAGRFLVSPISDQYKAGFAFRDFAAQALRAGEGIPHWNPYLMGGVPFIAGMAGDIFYPTALLRAVMPTDLAMSWGFALHVFMAGLFTFGFLRAWGLGFYPALVGGAAYMLSGNLAGLVSPGHDGKLFVSALLPLALWLLVRGVRDGRIAVWGGLALVVGLALLSPHPQLAQYMLLTCGAFGLYLALSADLSGARLARPVAARRLGYALGAVVLGFVIAAVQYLPVMAYVPWSPRAAGKGYEYAITYSMPIEELVNGYLPQFSGILDRYWGRNVIHFHSDYLGAAALLLAAAAFGSPARQSFRRFWLGVLVVSVLWALGGNTPFYHLVYNLVPGSKFFRAPSTILMVVSLATAVLAALGAERLLAGAVSRRFAIGWVAGAGVVALLATLGVLTTIAQSVASGFGAGDLYEVVASNQGALTLGAWRSFFFVGLACALATAARTRRLREPLLGALLTAVVAVDLWSVERLYWNFSEPASSLFATDPAIEFLKTAPVGRVIAVPVSREGYNASDPNYRGDGLMVHRIRHATGYHGNEIGRFQRLGNPEGGDTYPNLLNPAFWRLQNIRYLYTNADVTAEPRLAEAFGPVQKLVGPVKNAAGSTVYLFRLSGDNPPAWVAPVMVRAGDDMALAGLLDPNFDPRRLAVVDSAASVGVTSLGAMPAPLAITSTVTRYEPGRISLELSAPAPAGSALVMSENYYPGWTAAVDGRPAPTVRANLTQIGVPLTAGATRVTLSFTDAAYATGKLLSLVGALGALVLVIAGVFLERRRRAA